ncbi:hypothetical protein C4D51_09330 [Clostridium perfringens]|nr:hypothetical protein [Clostridium perfringens]
MSINDIKELYKNFSINDWKQDQLNNDKILIYNGDPKLTIRLTGKCLREDNDALNMNSYDYVFNKYNIDYAIYSTFYYDDVCIDDYKCTLLGDGDTLIPLPVGANRSNEFYENEYNIAKVFSDERFDELMKDAEIYSKFSEVYL